MPRFCANLSLLFAELDFMDRFAAAKDADFDAVEILSPYDVPVQDVVHQLAMNSLAMVMIDCPPPNYTGGAPGYAAVPGSRDRFRQDVKRTLRYAKALSARTIHLSAGVAEGPEAAETYIENLQWAADQAPKQMFTIEPQNAKDAPGAFLNDYHQAHQVIEAVDRPNLRLQFDVYQAGMIHGDIAPVWDVCRDVAVHVQVAQIPKRTEPDNGAIDYPAFFARLDREGYDGWVSAEYIPAGTTAGGLGWLAGL